jgi:hypothetical protein
VAANPLPAIDALKAIVNFAQLPDLQQATPAGLRKIEQSVQRFINRESPGHWRFEGEAPDWKRLEALRERAYRLLKAFAERGVAPAGDLRLTFVAALQDGSVRVHVTGEAEARLPYQIVRVLEAVGPDRLLKCPACGRMFVKVTKKSYCSTRCYGTAYMKVYRAEQKKKRRK